MPQEKIRLALAGCGGMAGAHLNAYGQLKRKGIDTFDLIAVCDPAVERAQGFARRFREFQETPEARVYADLEEMLASETLQAADLGTPHHLHHTTTIACLEAGLDVMVEKPLGVTIRAGWKMIEAADRCGRVLATAEQVRRWLGPRVLAWAIQEAGLIGPPRMFFAQHSSGAKRDPAQPVLDHPRTWRQDKLTGGGGTIFDGGVHYADVLLYLYGDVETVYAVTGNYAGWQYPEPDGTARPAEVEDTAIGHLTFQSGVVGTWTWAGACPGRALSHQIYYGRDGSLYAESTYPLAPEWQRWDGQVTPFADLVRLFLANVDEATLHRFFPPEVVLDPAAPTGDYGVELECYDFLEAVRLRRPPDIDGRAGLRAQAVSQAFFESSVSGQAVKVDDVLNGKVDAYQREINERWGL